MAGRQVRFLDTGYPTNPAGPGGCIGDGSMSGPRGIFARLLGMRWFHLAIFLGEAMETKEGPGKFPPNPKHSCAVQKLIITVYDENALLFRCYGGEETRLFRFFPVLIDSPLSDKHVVRPRRDPKKYWAYFSFSRFTHRRRAPNLGR